MRWVASILSWLTFGCAGFQDKTVEGVPNLVQAFPGQHLDNLWRMGQPADDNAWRYLASVIAPSGSRHVTVVKLNDAVEGNDSFARDVFGWNVVEIPLPPEDDKPWTVLDVPRTSDVMLVLATIAEAELRGDVVVWHCSHGRDRTSLIAALLGMKTLGWSKSKAWNDMLVHGFRWELPDLDIYWSTKVR
jgi:hypothetical protein